jgi:LL-diaminopimelate aminotransferase
MPPDILEFAEASQKRGLLRREDAIDLASFRWPVEFDQEQLPDQEGLKPATGDQISQLRRQLAEWLDQTNHIKVLPDKEVFIGGGISTLVHQVAIAYIDAGDVAFVPGLGIPVYRRSVIACNGEPISYTISAKNDWIPQFGRLSSRLGPVARMLFLNNPHNPTGAELSEKEISELAWLAGRENILLINDAAYSSVTQRQPVSLLSTRGGKRVGVELHSFSYQFGLPRLPFGYAVGNREVISGLKKVSRLSPTYLPSYFVELAVQAIRRFPGQSIKEVRETVTTASAEAGKLLDVLHLESSGYTGVPFIWAQIERRTPSTNTARLLLRKHRLLVAPGSVFGETGEGFLRFCLLAGADTFSQAAARIKKRRILRPKGKK